jgi:ABC-2 type transport system ATP-binding protein
MEEADRLCQRVAILDRGHIVALDAPAELKRQQAGAVTGSGASEPPTLEDVFIALTGHALYHEA